MIKQLGLLHLGSEYENLTFRPAAMFRRKKDELARWIDVPTSLLDFIDWPVFFGGENFPEIDTALKVATAVGGGWIGFNTWMDQAFVAAKLMGNVNLRQVIFPSIVITGWSTPTAQSTVPVQLIIPFRSRCNYLHCLENPHCSSPSPFDQNCRRARRDRLRARKCDAHFG